MDPKLYLSGVTCNAFNKQNSVPGLLSVNIPEDGFSSATGRRGVARLSDKVRLNNKEKLIEEVIKDSYLLQVQKGIINWDKRDLLG